MQNRSQVHVLGQVENFWPVLAVSPQMSSLTASKPETSFRSQAIKRGGNGKEKLVDLGGEILGEDPLQHQQQHHQPHFNTAIESEAGTFC